MPHPYIDAQSISTSITTALISDQLRLTHISDSAPLVIAVHFFSDTLQEFDLHLSLKGMAICSLISIDLLNLILIVTFSFNFIFKFNKSNVNQKQDNFS